LNLGPPFSRDPKRVNFRPEVPEQRPHPLSEGTGLAERLASGVIARNREEQVFYSPDPKARYVHDIGYRLLGPTLVLLLQSLHGKDKPTGFAGIGSGLMTTLGQSLRHAWPWLPQITEENKAEYLVSLLPTSGNACALLPARPGSPSFLSMEICSPGHLLLAPMEAFLLAAAKGPQAARLQASATAFVTQYARLSRGLYLPLSPERVIQQWRQQILSPKSDFIRVLLREKILPDFKRARSPWEAKRQVKEGVWPTGYYLLTRGMRRHWVRLMAPDRARAIEQWQEALKQADMGG